MGRLCRGDLPPGEHWEQQEQMFLSWHSWRCCCQARRLKSASKEEKDEGKDWDSQIRFSGCWNALISLGAPTASVFPPSALWLPRWVVAKCTVELATAVVGRALSLRLASTRVSKHPQKSLENDGFGDATCTECLVCAFCCYMKKQMFWKCFSFMGPHTWMYTEYTVIMWRFLEVLARGSSWLGQKRARCR